MLLDKILKERKDLPTMSVEATVMDAIENMRESGSGVILIVNDDNELLGLFSERDAMLQLATTDMDPKATPLGESMVTDIIKIQDTTTPSAALKTMVKGRIRHLPVVDSDDHLVGLLSLRYLLHDRITGLRDELQGLEAYLNDAQGG